MPKTEIEKTRKSEISKTEETTTELLPDYSDVFRPIRDDDKENHRSLIGGGGGGYSGEKSKAGKLKAALKAKKTELLRACSVSTVGNPRLEKAGDPARMQILSLAEEVAKRDGEFVLKVGRKGTISLQIRIISVHAVDSAYSIRLGASFTCPLQYKRQFLHLTVVKIIGRGWEKLNKQ